MITKIQHNKHHKVKEKRTLNFQVDSRIRLIIGLLLILFSMYLFLALIGFFFAGGADQSLIDKSTRELYTVPEMVAKNPVGKLGAIVSNLLINRWFGISSFLFCYLFFILGLHVIGKKITYLLTKMLMSLVAIIWISCLFGYISHFIPTSYLFPGGAHGYFVSEWCNSMVGEIGTSFLLLLTLIVILFFGFNGIYERFVEAKEAFLARRERKREEKQRQADALKTGEENQHTPEENDESFLPSVNPLPDEKKREDDVSDENIPSGYTSDDVELTVAANRQEEQLNKNLQPDEEYDPTLELSRYQYPTLELLEEHSSGHPKVTAEELEENKKTIVETLSNYKIEITKIKATIGPTVTLYEIVPAPGVKISRIKNLEDDIALSLAALGIRIIAPIPGAGTIGIEVPNQNPEIVSMRGIIASKKFQESKYTLPIALGRTISNEPYTFDLTKMPHLLVAGATGQGKSVGLNAIITSLLYKKHPAQLKFVMIDPKKVELSIYSVIEKHFLAKLPGEEDAIITETSKVVTTLKSICLEMDNRYDLLKLAQVRNIKEYNEKFIKRHLNPNNGHRFLPYIVVIVDEFADLIMTAGKEVEQPIARIAQLARAVGIHMIIATQRPSTNIITGVIKANFPARMAFKVASMIDSRTILDTPGANQLIGRGDMLISVGSEMTRVQCALVDTPEVDAITEFIAVQQGYPEAYELPEYHEDAEGSFSGEMDLGAKDPLFEEAARLVVNTQQGSTSSIQRRFSIGYNRAGRIVDQLEAAGIVGPFEGSKARQVLISDGYALEQLLNAIGDHF